MLSFKLGVKGKRWCMWFKMVKWHLDSRVHSYSAICWSAISWSVRSLCDVVVSHETMATLTIASVTCQHRQTYLASRHRRKPAAAPGRRKPGKVELRPRSTDYYCGAGRWIGAGIGPRGRSELGGPRSHIGVSAIIAVRRAAPAKRWFLLAIRSQRRSMQAVS